MFGSKGLLTAEPLVALPYQNQAVHCYSRAPFNNLRALLRSEAGEADIDAEGTC